MKKLLQFSKKKKKNNESQKKSSCLNLHVTEAHFFLLSLILTINDSFSVS